VLSCFASAINVEMAQFDKGKPILPPISKPVANTIINPVSDEEKERIRNAEVATKLNKFKLFFGFGGGKKDGKDQKQEEKVATHKKNDVGAPDDAEPSQAVIDAVRKFEAVRNKRRGDAQIVINATGILKRVQLGTSGKFMGS
jgi:hypothetical protein